MEENLFKIVALIFTALCIAVSVYVKPYIDILRENKNLEKWNMWAKAAVNCAEMVLPTGKSKKEFCVNFLSGLINKKKVILTEDQISILIEAAVKELKIAEGL